MITSYFKTKGTSKSTVAVQAAKKRAHGEIDDPGRENSETDPPKRTRQITNSFSTTPNSSHLTDKVQELLVHLNDEDEAEKGSWKRELHAHFLTPGFSDLAKFVNSERQSHTIYPPSENTFAALNMTPLKSVKVVIVGQDPYHGPGQAHGLCFSVLPGQPIPPSLKNIYKELKDDPAVSFPSNGVMPRHGHLIRWAKQGVLMLNSVLTVRRGEANSHQKRGWERFTDEIIRTVDRYSRTQKTGLVFLLWGKPAATKAQAILAGSTTPHHTIICSSHPSPLGASKTNQPFLGSRCFSRCNEALKASGLEPIDWNVDGD